MVTRVSIDDILPRHPISLVAMDSFAPFRGGNGSSSHVDLSYIPTQARFHEANGMDMVILQGTTGEWPALSTSERLAMAAAWRQAVPAGSRMKLILHVGHDSLVDAQLLAERAVSLEMDAVLISAPSKFIAHSAQHQAQAVVDIMAHCSSIPAFYYHYPGIYGDRFDIHQLMQTIESEVARRGLTQQANLVGAKLSIPLDEASAAVQTFSVDPDHSWGLTVGTVDPKLWDAPAMSGVIVFSWEGPLWQKAFDLYNAGDLAGATAVQNTIATLRVEGSGSLVHVSNTSNYTVQGHKALAVALGIDVGPVRLPLPLVSTKAAKRAAAHVLRVMEKHDALPDFSMLTTDDTPSSEFDWTGVDQFVVPAAGGLSKPLVMLRTCGGYLMCGLLNIGAPNRLGEVAGIVRGVDSPEDILTGQLEEVSERAKERGIKVGMTGAEALAVMKTLDPTASKL